MLDKELRKISTFYEEKERELLMLGDELERDLLEEEEKDLERVKEETSWDQQADVPGFDQAGDGEENEGESQLGSLAGFSQRKSRSRSRGRISSTSRLVSLSLEYFVLTLASSFAAIFHGSDGSSAALPASDRDTTDLFEAQQSYHAAKLRNTNPYTLTDGEEHDEDSSPENSPRISTAPLNSSTSYFDGKHTTPPSHKRTSSERSGAPSKSPTTFRRRPRRSSLVSSSTAGVQAAAPGELGLVPVDPITLSSAAPGTMSTMHASATSEGFHSSANGVPIVYVWTAAGQHASMLKILYKRRIAQLWFDWTALASFRELNQEGIKKAIKK